MRCISIRQPWAWLIVNGFKDIENRSRCFHYLGELLIHAGQQWHQSFDPKFSDRFQDKISAINPRIIVPRPEEMNRGGIVGVTNIVDCVHRHDSPWFEGPFGLVMTNSMPLPFVPCKGFLGIFDVQFNVKDTQ